MQSGSVLLKSIFLNKVWRFLQPVCVQLNCVQFLVLVLLLITTLARADYTVQSTSVDVTEKIEKKLSALLNRNIKALSVYKTDLFGGLYEVRIGEKLLYTDENVSYLIAGDVHNGKTFENLTETRLNQLTAIQFSELPLDLAIKTINGKGTRKIAVFEDPNCGYCKRFRKTLLEIDDLTIYTFVVPVLGPDSTQKVKALWCSSDKTKAWDDWMLNNKPFQVGAACDGEGFERLNVLRSKLKIAAVPTVFFADGTRLPGIAPKNRIEQRLMRKN